MSLDKYNISDNEILRYLVGTINDILLSPDLKQQIKKRIEDYNISVALLCISADINKDVFKAWLNNSTSAKSPRRPNPKQFALLLKRLGIDIRIFFLVSEQFTPDENITMKYAREHTKELGERIRNKGSWHIEKD